MNNSNQKKWNRFTVFSDIRTKKKIICTFTNAWPAWVI